MGPKTSENKGFLAAYERLNTEQREAVDSIEGPVMVIAGPGTGKTQILALRVANILLKTDTRPENILTLTFTDSGAHAMRERLRRYIGEESYRVAVHTFHSLAGQLIRNYPDAYPSIIGGRPAGDIERTVILENILETAKLDSLRPAGDPLYYVKKIPGAIAELKKENIDPGAFTEIINKLETRYLNEPKYHEKGAHKGKIKASYQKNLKHLEKLRELALVYRLYQQLLRERKLYDFEDMIMETVRALTERQDLLLDLQETYQYILADEHQDVNEAQNRILELLASYHESPNIFVVGDEKQAIYRFQGASLHNFLYFENRFQGTKVIALTDNYRSTKPILDAAHSLIKSDDPELARLRVPLTAAEQRDGQLPELRLFSHEAVEDEWVIKKIKELLDAGTPPQEVAVILRNNREVIHFTSLLRRFGVDANASTDGDILDHPLTHLIENLLRATARPHDQNALFNLFTSGCLDLNSADIISILSARNGSWSLGRIIYDQDKLAMLELKEQSKVEKIAQTLQEAREKAPYTAPHHVLEQLLDAIGLVDRLMKQDPVESSRVLRRLYDDLEILVVENGAATLNDAVKLLEYRRAHHLPLLANFIESDRSAVNVMTAHKAKGLEFEVVIIPRATDSCFGGSKGRDYFKLPIYPTLENTEDGEEEDEKRLLYVAMTRAKKVLLLSSSETGVAGKLDQPSRFFSDIPESEVLYVSTEDLAEEFNPTTLLSSPLTPIKPDPEMIKALFLKRGLSVTHLNNYLEDPKKYYFENLLRRPSPPTLFSMKGRSVHETLERVLTTYKETGKWPTAAKLAAYLKDAFDNKPLSDQDAVRLHDSAFASLVPYIEHLKSSIGESFRTEYHLQTTLLTGDKDLSEIPLNGNIDRVDIDTNNHMIRVTDYKTGKPKSRNEVEGKTKNSNGNYRRQLAFYALLFKLARPDEPRPLEYVLSFVEPKENGEIVEYVFSVEDAEIEELIETIKRVAKEIVSGEKF